MKNISIARGLKTQIIYSVLATLTVMLGMGGVIMAQTNEKTPVDNIILVHGGFVDGSGWEGVYKILKSKGYNVTIVQNPTISLADDA